MFKTSCEGLGDLTHLRASFLKPRLSVLMADAPSNGDVLITTEGDRHLLSVVPHPHRLSLSEYAVALQIARRWAVANQVTIWRANDGVFTKLSD